MLEPKKISQLLSADNTSEDLDTLTKQLEAVIDETNWHANNSENNFSQEKNADIIELEKELAALKKERELIDKINVVKEDSSGNNTDDNNFNETKNVSGHKKNKQLFYHSFRLVNHEWKKEEQRRQNNWYSQLADLRAERALKKAQEKIAREQILRERLIKLQQEKENQQKIFQEKLLAKQERILTEEKKRAEEKIKRESEKQIRLLTDEKRLADKKQQQELIEKMRAEKKQAKLFVRQQRHEERQQKQEAIRQKEIRDQEYKKLLRAKVLVQSKKQKKPRGWYLSMAKRPILYLAGIEFLIYFLSLIPSWQNLFLNIILPYVLILDMVVWIWMTIRLRFKHGADWRATTKALLLAGLLVGLARAIFKVIWIGELWTVFNLILETLLESALAGLIALVVNAVIRKKTFLDTADNNPSVSPIKNSSTFKYELEDL